MIARTANAPTATPIPIPAFAPVDNPDDAPAPDEDDCVAAAPLVVADAELAVRELEDVEAVGVARKSAAFHRIDTPYAFNPPAAVLITPYLLVLVPLTEVKESVELGRSDPLTVHASVAYWGQFDDF